MQDNWFTVEDIDKNTFAISEYGHWEKPHCYLFIGSEKSVLIDTGLGIGNVKKIVQELTQLPTLVVITHAHWDHTSGCKGFGEIAIHELDKNWLENGLPISEKQIRKNLLKEPFTKNPPENFSIETWKPFTGRASVVLEDNDEINLGNRVLKVIHTPGHSPGHICIYEKETGYLVTGDLLYEGKLDAFYESTDPQQFYTSIEKIDGLKPTKLLPGHNNLNIPVFYIKEARDAFVSLSKAGKLKHGTGIHTCTHFSIHL